MPQGKILSQVFKKEWKNDKGTFYSHAINIEGIGEGEINTKEQNPSWLKIGELIEVEVTEGQYGKRFKRVAPQKGFGGGAPKARVFTQEELISLAKSQAISTLVSLNAKHKIEIIKSTELSVIVDFILSGISGSLTENTDAYYRMNHRIETLRIVSEMSTYKTMEDGKQFMDMVLKTYKYIVS
jgi:hypothetical protein